MQTFVSLFIIKTTKLSNQGDSRSLEIVFCVFLFQATVVTIAPYLPFLPWLQRKLNQQLQCGDPTESHQKKQYLTPQQLHAL
jgi:hypothetical protein